MSTIPKDEVIRQIALSVIEGRPNRDDLRSLARWALFKIGADPACPVCGSGHHEKCADCGDGYIPEWCACRGGWVKAPSAPKEPRTVAMGDDGRCLNASVWRIAGAGGGGGWCVCDAHKRSVLAAVPSGPRTVRRLKPTDSILLTARGLQENRARCEVTTSNLPKTKPAEKATGVDVDALWVNDVSAGNDHSIWCYVCNAWIVLHPGDRHAHKERVDKVYLTPQGVAPTATGPRYKHGCTRCTFLGRHGACDLYFCPQSGISTVIARYGNDGPDYTSGLCGADHVPELAEAQRRAERAGLLTETKKGGG